uniref:Uncharacterized protein n=1 Tax=Glossina palpalis gambiensis TaxID=67801 RepID=A0A1B0C1B9_9MUSC
MSYTQLSDQFLLKNMALVHFASNPIRQSMFDLMILLSKNVFYSTRPLELDSCNISKLLVVYKYPTSKYSFPQVKYNLGDHGEKSIAFMPASCNRDTSNSCCTQLIEHLCWQPSFVKT